MLNFWKKYFSLSRQCFMKITGDDKPNHNTFCNENEQCKSWKMSLSGGILMGTAWRLIWFKDCRCDSTPHVLVRTTQQHGDMMYEVMCFLGLHHKWGYLIVAIHENLGKITLNDLPRGDVHVGCELQHFYLSTIISILVLILCKPLVLSSELWQCCY